MMTDKNSVLCSGSERYVLDEQAVGHLNVIKHVLKENKRFLPALRFFFGKPGRAFSFEQNPQRPLHVPDAATYALVAAKIDGEQSVLAFLDDLSPNNQGQ